MSLDIFTTADAVSDRDMHLQTQQYSFEAKQAAFLREIENCQKHRHHLQQLRLHFEQERQVYQQEQAYLWEHLRAKRRLRGEDEQPSPAEQQLRQMMEGFSATLASLHQNLTSARQIFLDRLDDLREQRVLVRELQDPIQRLKAYQHLQEQYQRVQEELREAKRLLREQQETYRQVRLDIQAAQMLLRSEKAVIEQRQEARRWQGYGYTWIGREHLWAV